MATMILPPGIDIDAVVIGGIWIAICLGIVGKLMWRDLANNQISKQKEQNKNTPLRPHSKLLGRRNGRGSDRGGGR